MSSESARSQAISAGKQRNMTDRTLFPLEASTHTVEGSTSALGSVSVALRMLSLFVTRSTVGVSEAAVQLGVSRSSAHRILATLEQHAFVSQEQITKAYHCGPALIDIALSSLGGLGIGRLTIPLLQRIVDATGETAHLAFLSGRTAFFIEAVESTAILRAGARVGTMLPAECCSVGRALLAQKSNGAIRALYPSDTSLVRLTSASPRSVAALLERLDQARDRGWADNLGESEQDLHAVAVPVLSGRGEATLALACTGPAQRLPIDRLPSLGAILIEVAGDLAAMLISDPREQNAKQKSRRHRRTGGEP
jgi:DNA-binding IclR family transcriptional regulator